LQRILRPVGTTGGISQTWNNFVIGDFYTISYAFLSDGGAPGSFNATIDGQVLTNLVNQPPLLIRSSAPSTGNRYHGNAELHLPKQSRLLLP
jgi:hypothetical protein